MKIGARLHPMTVRTPSLILAALFLLCGSGICFTIPKVLETLSGLGDTLPIVTRVVLFPRPIGWVVIGGVFSFAVLVKDKSTHSRLLNKVFLVVLGLGLIFTVAVLFFPIVKEIRSLSSQ
jgi:hypothetical protein